MESIILLSKDYINPKELINDILKTYPKYNINLRDDDIIFIKNGDDALFIYLDGMVDSKPRDLDETLEMYSDINLPISNPYSAEIEYYNIDFAKKILSVISNNDKYIDNNHGIITSLFNFINKDNPLEEGPNEDKTIIL